MGANPTQHTTHSHDRALGETNSTIGSRHDHIPPLFHCQHINLHAGLPGIFKYLTAQSIPADVSEGLRPNSKQEATAEMIESGPGIAESLAAAARASWMNRLRNCGHKEG